EVSGRALRLARAISIARLLGPRTVQSRPGTAERLVRGTPGDRKTIFLDGVGEKKEAPAFELQGVEFMALLAVKGATPADLEALQEKVRDRFFLALQPEVTRLLRSDDIDENSLLSLARLDHPDPKSPFLSLIRSPLQEVRYPATLILTTVDPIGGLPYLLELSKDSTAQIRQASVRALGAHPAPAVAAVLRELLKDGAFFVRSEAAQSLGRIGDSKAIPGIRNLLKDGSAGVWKSSVRALGALRAREALTDLLEALTDESPPVRAAAAGALGDLGVLESRPKISLLLEDPNLEVRESARLALSKLDPRD
ncbi:MAG TPA: HEAT repeat domain-containing protein, partial [Planctomycetota bacterium]|nr:HEAT repeat domain-containing protein [Planctomycetota bacterium]